MTRRLLECWICLCSVLFLSGCQGRQLPLDEEEFTALLLDMHRLDGILAVSPRVYGEREWKNYASYNGLFEKYHITQADFDSCMYWYSARTAEFSRMYDIIIDSLNRQLTAADKVMKELRSRDSVNYFPEMDTICLDSVHTVRVDSICPGLYKFSTRLKFDSLAPARSRRIESRFISADGKDTLKVRNLIIIPDTMKREYAWSQYVDSVYSYLEISYMVPTPEKERLFVYEKYNPSRKKGRNQPKPKRRREVLYDPRDFGVISWDNRLYRPYISKRTAEQLKMGLRR